MAILTTTTIVHKRRMSLKQLKSTTLLNFEDFEKPKLHFV